MVHPREHVAVKALESERACTSIEHRNVMRIVRRAMEQREKLENSVGNTLEDPRLSVTITAKPSRVCFFFTIVNKEFRKLFESSTIDIALIDT